MQALIETRRDASMAIEFDSEAARAKVAGMVFAARFHVGIAPLAGMVEEGFERDRDHTTRRAVCQ